MAEHAGAAIEHQRLHGMGEALYAAAEDEYGPLNLRAYAPVGGHEDLLFPTWCGAFSKRSEQLFRAHASE